jgi:hypothetical protein
MLADDRLKQRPERLDEGKAISQTALRFGLATGRMSTGRAGDVGVPQF